MNGRRLAKIVILVALVLASLPAFGATWFVRPDGGSRYTQARIAAHLKGQCDGLADAPYPGSGSNRHCAFNDVRSLWSDGTYDGSAHPAWIIAGGDIVIIRGAIRDAVSYRIGWPNAEGAFDTRAREMWGIPGDPYGSGMPTPPSGTEQAHTRILGANYESCHNADARTQLHGGFGVNTVINMSGASYVDLACLDITDFSACGRAAQKYGCNTNPGHLDDYASAGVSWSSSSTHDTLTDVSVHGIAGSGMVGPTGDGTVFDYLSLIGNAAAGWNADNGTTGTGSLLVKHFNISWNGCAEQYPTRQALPYDDCTDDNSGGYGDGFGTTTLPSKPGWTAVFDDGVVSYNTQDGLDALHLTGTGSSTTVSHTLAYGNMGQQIKIGGNQAVVKDNIIYTNCNAMRQNIPGTPAGYNSRLSDFCRAADTGIFISVNDGTTTVFEGNIVYSAGATILQVGIGDSCATSSCRVLHRNNTFLGFPKSKANGYTTEATGEYPNAIYLEDAIKAYLNPDSSFDNNTVYHMRPSWKCPNKAMHEKDATCTDPHLKDESWHNYGYGDTSPTVSASGGSKSRTEPTSGDTTVPSPVRRMSIVLVPCIIAASLSSGIYSWVRRSTS